MKLADVNRCTGCGACESICPRRCIRMEADIEGFLQPIVEREKCIDCCLCQKVCPIISPLSYFDSHTSAYAALNLDSTVRERSTSGGVFTALCKWTLERGGIIVGAAYDENFKVKHCLVDSESELWRLQGAKYVQSNLEDVFSQVKSCLLRKQMVLFPGTPCQTAGLQAYLGKTKEQLLLVDLVCHGVPSPAVWEHYVQYRSIMDADGVMPLAVNLRSKESGWPEYSVRFDYKGSKRYIVKNFKDPYLRAFVCNLCLRPSCYVCQFKGLLRTSDFTLADYWGIERQVPELHDGKGTSLVLLHSEKAKLIWQDLAPKMRYQEVNPDVAVRENPSAIQAVTAPSEREAFMKRYAREDFTKLVEELIPPQPGLRRLTLPQRIINKVKRIF